MSTHVEQHKEVFAGFRRAVNRHDWSLGVLGKFLKADVVDHTAESGGLQGIEGVQQRLAEWHAAFDEATEIDLATVGEHDVLSVLYETRARHAGTYMGIPATNRRVTIPGIRFLRFEEGKIAEMWGIYDYFTTAMEIGAGLSLTPRPGMAVAPPVNFGKPSPIPREDDPASLGTGPTAVNKALLLRFRDDVFNANDWSTANLSRFLSPNIIDHNAFPGDPPGLEGVRVRFSMWRDAFDDASEEFQAIAGENDLLAVRYALPATHTGAYLGVPPTNRQVRIPGIEFLRFEQGLIAEHWGIYDFKATAEQIGAALTFTPQAVSMPPKPVHPHARFSSAGAIRQ